MVPNQIKAESPFMSRGVQLCPYLIVSLLDISQRSNIEALIEEETYQNIIVETIETLAMFSGEKEFYDHIVK